jgi:hypothetical protein
MLALDGVLLKERPRVLQWFGRIRDRPSFPAAIENHMTEHDRDYFTVSREEIEAGVRKIMRSPVPQNARKPRRKQYVERVRQQSRGHYRRQSRHRPRNRSGIRPCRRTDRDRIVLGRQSRRCD